jgi:hypothetical protein
MGKSALCFSPFFAIFKGFEIFAETATYCHICADDHYRFGGHVFVAECGQPG